MDLKVLLKHQLVSKVAVIVGTRPGIVKFAPIIKELIRRNICFTIIHTGQHYSPNMEQSFFDDLDLPQADYFNTETQKCKLHGEQTAEMLRGVEQALLIEKPSVAIVGGDANTNLSAALAIRKLGIKLVHMEAGLRSFDWSMPEEHNRVIIDNISDILLPPTQVAKNNLKKANLLGKIVLTGNPIVDSALENMAIAEKKSKILNDLSLEKKKYFLLTAHREENVDNESRLNSLCESISFIAESYNYKIIFPLHPRTKIRLENFNLMKNLKSINNLVLIEPLGYLDFTKLMNNSYLVMTDSGGIQEEACVLGVPCITLRENTERPETIDVKSNIIAGVNKNNISRAIDEWMNDGDRKWHNPFGDNAASNIVDVLVAEM